MFRMVNNASHTLLHTPTTLRTASTPTCPIFENAIDGASDFIAIPYFFQRRARHSHICRHQDGTPKFLSASLATCTAIVCSPLGDDTILNVFLHRRHLVELCANLLETTNFHFEVRKSFLTIVLNPSLFGFEFRDG